MLRSLRIEYPGALHHVTNRGNARADIVRDDDDRRLFVDLLGAAVERFAWLRHAWCLMDNHYHLLVETPMANLSGGMRQLNGVFTQRPTGPEGGPGTSSKAATRLFWSSARRISWSSAAMWCRTRSAPAWWRGPGTGLGAAFAPPPATRPRAPSNTRSGATNRPSSRDGGVLAEGFSLRRPRPSMKAWGCR